MPRSDSEEKVLHTYEVLLRSDAPPLAGQTDHRASNLMLIEGHNIHVDEGDLIIRKIMEPQGNTNVAYVPAGEWRCVRIVELAKAGSVG